MGRGCSRWKRELHEALEYSDPLIEEVQEIVDNYPPCLEIADKEGQIPLHIAVGNPDISLEVIEYLIEEFPDGVNEKDNCGYVPLHEAIVSGLRPRMEVIRLLVEKNPRGLQEKSIVGWLPLHAACNPCRSIELIRYLMDQYPAGVQHKDDYGQLPLHLALAGSWDTPVDLNMIRLLVQRYPQSLHERTTNLDEQLPLHVALDAKKPSIEIVRFLVQEFPASVRAPARKAGGWPPFLFAAERSHPGSRASSLDVIFFLIQQNPLGMCSLAKSSTTANEDAAAPAVVAAPASAPALLQPVRKKARRTGK